LKPLLEIRDVALIRGERLLFEGLQLRLDPGEAIHLTGPNGSGKSSLIRLVAGLLRATSGFIERAEAALADDGLALDAELPLGKALAFWRLPHLQQSLERLNLSDLAGVPVRLLSTGQAKRAVLARVLGSGAPLWLLDEPLNGLDRQGLGALEDAIRAHRKNGGAVLAASHVPMGGSWRELGL